MSKNTIIAILSTFILTLVVSIFISSVLLKNRLNLLNSNIDKLDQSVKLIDSNSELISRVSPLNIRLKLYEIDGVKVDNTNQRAFTIEEFIEYYNKFNVKNNTDSILINNYFKKNSH